MLYTNVPHHNAPMTFCGRSTYYVAVPAAMFDVDYLRERLGDDYVVRAWHDGTLRIIAR